ncbi:SAM-dependent methyltransferase [Solibacillus sp. R5-41]|uniref:class I SAM-dependent methyltransferase n=1 Tax=Solibacillus sp. R5-41 TaxID=2048654 RepID=UPI000C128507|nr:class I SAM-dependent methyltransferase [Solibacillus sp. R5-41]ATP41326.1 SAM-dependent methyltransferase [Solibacillus sp. R5-41]
MLVKSEQDLLKLLDTLLREPQSFWDDFYQDKLKPIPFFINKPDENLVDYIETGKIQPKKVLELGCGAGRNAIYLAKQGFSVVGVDLSENALHWANERAEEAKLEIDFIHSDIFELDLQENNFDLIYDSGCFHHLAPHRRITYLELIHKFLKTDGYFALCSFEVGGAYGGSDISDEEVYKKRTLDGGLGYTEQQLKEVFQSLNEIEIRKMIPMSDQDNYFGLDGFIVGLFKK